MAVNLRELCRTWYTDHIDSNGIDDNDGYGDEEQSDDSRINLNLVKPYVRAGTLRWSSAAPAPEFWGPQRTLTVQRRSGGSDATGHLKSKKESEMTSTVTLAKGVIEGLTQKLKLPFPPEVSDKLGDFVRLDISQSVSELPKDKMVTSVTVDHPVTRNMTSATVRSTVGQYQGSFLCHAGLQGVVLFREEDGPLQQDIFEVVRDLKSDDQGDSQLNKLQIYKKDHGVVFPMEGYCDFCWEFDQNFVLN